MSLNRMFVPARRAAACLVVAAGLALSAAPTVVWADEPLPTDPALVMGQLENGLKYIIRQHATPKEHVAIWMHVSSGSINETDPQRGLAHYLEHMAFNGSKNFPPGKVIPLFESLGLTFGRHQNAFTSFDQTTYQLDLGKNDPEQLAKAMLFMSDVAFRLSLLPGEIEAERQIILNEKQARSGAQQRIGEYMIANMAPESLIGKRIPIGTEETVKNVQKPDFEAYYNTRYVASNMTVIVVGDIDPKIVIEQIKANFADGKKVAAPADQDAGVKPLMVNRAVVASDPEITVASVGIGRILAARPPTTTVEGMREEILDQIADFAFARRCQARVASGKATFFSCGASVQNMFNAAMQVNVTASGKPEQWKTLLTEAATELQRARLHGFTAQEVEDAKKDILADAEVGATREGTLPARALLGRYNGAVAAGEPIMSGQQTLEAVKKILPTISAAQVSEQFTRLFDPSVAMFTATLPSTADVPTESQLIELGVAALKVTPEKEAAEVRASGFMEKAPTPGKVAEASEHAASSVAHAWFENGIRVHHKFMDARKDEVSIEITLAGGVINETAANRGLTQAAGIAFSGRTMATKSISSTQIRDLMTGRKVRVGSGGGGPMAMLTGGAGPDSVGLSVSGSPSDLETGMQLAHLLLTEPKIEEVAFDKWKQQQKQVIAMIKMAPQGALLEGMMGAMYPAGESRPKPLTAEQVDAVTIEAAQAWLDGLITKAPIEVSVVGDITKERAMELVTTYLGSLGKRDRVNVELFKDKRTIARPGKAVVVDKEIATATDQAQVVAGFFGVNATDIRDVRLMELSAQIVSSRMIKVIREEKNLVYSISAQNQPGEAYPGFGMFIAMAPTKPGKTAELSEAVYEIFDEFAKTGPSAEELEVAKKQKANTLAEGMKEPGFWTVRLATLDYRGRSLDEVVRGIDAYNAFTTEDVKQAFAKYDVPEGRINVRVSPAPKSEGENKVEPPKN